MNLTWNQQLIKKENKTLVLNMIKKNEAISRADIAQESGLNKGTVSSLVAELIHEDLVIEKGPGISSGGRRPVLLVFNQLAGYSIGIDLGVNYIHAVLTDLQGNIIAEKNAPYKSTSINQTMAMVKEKIAYMKKTAPDSTYGIVGIGIGVPGIIDKDSSVLIAPNLGWKNSSIREEIESAFQIPVIVENEANAGAYGEKVFGLGKDIDNLVYISAGIGIGTGIIIDGKLFRGFSGFSGEFGHMTIQMDGAQCRCGNNGCWELYASEQYLLEHTHSLNQNIDEFLLDRLIEKAEDNHKEIIHLLEQTGSNLGIGIVNIIHALNPQQLIIGNRLATAGKWMKSAILAYVEKNTMPSHQKEIQIQFSEKGFPSVPLGVSAFSIENFLLNKLDIQ